MTFTAADRESSNSTATTTTTNPVSCFHDEFQLLCVMQYYEMEHTQQQNNKPRTLTDTPVFFCVNELHLYTQISFLSPIFFSLSEIWQKWMIVFLSVLFGFLLYLCSAFCSSILVHVYSRMLNNNSSPFVRMQRWTMSTQHFAQHLREIKFARSKGIFYLSTARK